MRLQDKVAFITGAAAGIGKTTALRFAQEGAKLFLTDVNEEKAAAVAEEIRSRGGQATALRHDVSKEEDWKQAVEKALAEYGRIDILFNNAGIYFIKPLADTTLEDFNKMMAINVNGVFLGMKHVVPHMASNKSGSVINASSIAGLKGAAGHVAYGASKGAVRLMTKDAAVEFAAAGVRINSIHPAYINTAMGDYAVATTRLSEEKLAESMAPMGRFGKVEEVAELVLFLASDESAFSTGAEFVIDGGATAR